MTDRVGIAGIGTNGYEADVEDALEELVHGASRAALDDAGIDRAAVDNVVVCADDLEDGRAISSMVAACPAGGYRKDFIKTTDTGIHALALAAMRIRAGVFDTCLVASWAKASENDLAAIKSLEADPFYHRAVGLGHATGPAAAASAYQDSAPNATQAADYVVEKNTLAGTNNDHAARDAVTTREDAGDSDVVASPLRDAHVPTPCDGACALLVAAEDVVTELTDDPVWLEGVGWETSSYNHGARPDEPMPALAGAADRAYAEAGVTPESDVDLVELHQSSAYHELMACEALGLCAPNTAAMRMLDGDFDRNSDCPVSPSGGAFGSNPLIATGLTTVVEATRQLTGRAEGCQVPEAERAIAHSSGSITDQIQAVAVLGGGA